MALLKCPECNNDVSEFASFCPHCGCPIDKIKAADLTYSLESLLDEENVVFFRKIFARIRAIYPNAKIIKGNGHVSIFIRSKNEYKIHFRASDDKRLYMRIFQDGVTLKLKAHKSIVKAIDDFESMEIKDEIRPVLIMKLDKKVANKLLIKKFYLEVAKQYPHLIRDSFYFKNWFKKVDFDTGKRQTLFKIYWHQLKDAVFEFIDEDGVEQAKHLNEDSFEEVVAIAKGICYKAFKK